MELRPSFLCGHQDDFLDLCGKDASRFWFSPDVIPQQSVLSRCEDHSFRDGFGIGYRELAYEEAVVFSVMAK